MRYLFHGLVLLLAIIFFVFSRAESYTKEEINTMFEPITSKYGVKIVYTINDDFEPIIIGGGRLQFDVVKPIETRVLARYPALLTKAFEKYPVSVIKEYLSAIYFAKELDYKELRYAGTYDAFRKIVYLIDNGNRSNELSIGTFHHEFSSLLLKRHTFFLNPWLEQNPKGFKYSKETANTIKDIYGVSHVGTPEDYNLGFMNAYCRISFEDDFNEYSKIIFMQPGKFKKIMNQYPRVRAKFKIWLDFYHKIDPIFTEEYVLSE